MRNEAKRQAKLARKRARRKAYVHARNIGSYESLRVRNVKKLINKMRINPAKSPSSQVTSKDKNMSISLKQDFFLKHLPGFWDKILFWFLFRRMKKVKKYLLWECLMDKLYFETEMKEKLLYNDATDRKVLGEENSKPEDKQDRAKIVELEEKISLAKAIKSMHRKNDANIEEVKQYLHLLDVWQNQN